jgi:hypothetical protein
MAKKESRDAARYGTRNGEIKFGHVHNDQVLSAFMARSGYDYRHYMTFEAEGKRAGTTVNRCPKVYEIKCGDDQKKGQGAFVVDVLNGDIILKARNGDIKLQARNIDILANENASGNDQGIVTIEGNEKIMMRTKNFEMNATSVAKFFSSGACELVAKSSMNFSAGLFAAVDNCCSGGNSKPSLWDSNVQSNNQLNTGTIQA